MLLLPDLFFQAAPSVTSRATAKMPRIVALGILEDGGVERDQKLPAVP